MTDTSFYFLIQFFVCALFTKHFFTNVLFLGEIGEAKERETSIYNWCWLPVASGSLLPLQTGTSKLPIAFSPVLPCLFSYISRVKNVLLLLKYVHLFQLLKNASGLHKGVYGEKKDYLKRNPFGMSMSVIKSEIMLLPPRSDFRTLNNF